ncbi:MAG: DNA internalization-related competence protein ComEC/Rec2 [Deltaproteobacteria bacterium]
MRKPLVPLLVAMMAGIVIGNYIKIPDILLLFCLFSAFILLLIPANLKNWKGLKLSLLMLSFLFLGVLNINLYLNPDQGTNHIIHYAGKGNIIIEGVISENPEVSPDKTEITVSATRVIRDDADVQVEGLVRLSVKNFRVFAYGDYVRFKVRLKVPHNFKNPGGFDYERYLRYEGISVRGFINDPSGIVVIRENQGNVLKTRLEKFRQRLKKIIRDNSLSPDGEIIQAMILGDQKEIPKDVMEKFNKTGTSHIIAISGFNIGIIAVLSMFIVQLIMKSSSYLLLRFNMNVVSAVFAIIPVVSYTFIAGMGMSVVRAAIMGVTFMIAIILGKERDLYNTLALAAFIILVTFPYALFDISFQLSFMAVWAILFITPRLMKWLPEVDHTVKSKYLIFNVNTLRNVFIFLIVSVSATLGTLPLIVYYFNRVSTIVIFSNIAVVPVLGIIAIPVSTAIILAALISPDLAILFVHLSSFLVWISVGMVDFFASLPGSSFFISTPTIPEIALYYCLLISGGKCMDFWLKSRKNENSRTHSSGDYFWYRVAFIVLFLFFFMDALYLNTRDLFRKNLEVTAIDVGQGSSTLVQLPDGRRMLIDGGGFPEGSFDVGKFVVAPYLWHERISKIDIVVLTHPHPDHLNGLIYILSNFDVREVWTSGERSGNESYRDFLRIISEKKINHKIISEKTGVIIMNDILIDIMNPENPLGKQDETSQKFQDVNNHSIVMKITYGNVSFLLPADISEPAETRLVRTGRDMRSQVLFVPHHGGFSSSTEPFIRRVQPDIVVVSCGADNIYKLPHPNVLGRYSVIGTRVLRTDRNGAVSIMTDGKNTMTRVFRESR